MILDFLKRPRCVFLISMAAFAVFDIYRQDMQPAFIEIACFLTAAFIDACASAREPAVAE